MKNLVIVLVIFSVLTYLGWTVVKTKYGNLAPALIPSSTDANLESNSIEDGRLTKSIFASDLGGPRDLQLTPGGTLLVSVPAKGIVLALPEKKEIISGLSKPHGLAMYNGKLFVAEENNVSRYSWNEGNRTAVLEKKLFDLPKGGRHTSRTIVFDSKGIMYVSVGSSCDVCFEKDERLASVLVSDEDGNNPHVLAKGLRNAPFLALNPKSGKVWATEMGRDFLGDDLPPDEINILSEGDYGWPVCYGNKVYDSKFGQMTEGYCRNTIPPVYEIPAHSAPLGLAFWKDSLLVAYHGSWNRSTPTGYKIVRLKLDGDRVVGVENFLTGFIQGNTAQGRPVDIEIGNRGEIYVSDDKAGVVYKLVFGV